MKLFYLVFNKKLNNQTKEPLYDKNLNTKLILACRLNNSNGK